MVLKLSQAINGFLLSCRARGLSPNTILDYKRTVNKLLSHLGDVPLPSIIRADVEHFLSSQTGVSNKTLLNYYIGLSAMMTWAVNEKVIKRNIVRELQPPRPEIRAIDPYTQEEIRRLIAAVSRSKDYTRPSKVRSSHSLGSAARMRAILLMLLDTGLRASELCDLRVMDVDVDSGKIILKGKGGKERRVEFGHRTGQALWRYLAERGELRGDEPLIVGRTGNGLDHRDLYHRVAELGKRAGVSDVHPHRFRHTFAIQYLRNGGDAYTLQALLGHSTMEMVRRYLKLAQVDLEAAHRRASPVENWRL